MKLSLETSLTVALARGVWETAALGCWVWRSERSVGGGRQQVCGMQKPEPKEPARRCLAPETQFLLSTARWRLDIPGLARSL